MTNSTFTQVDLLTHKIDAKVNEIRSNRYPDDYREADSKFAIIEDAITLEAIDDATGDVSYDSKSSIDLDRKVVEHGKSIAGELSQDEISIVRQLESAHSSFLKEFLQTPLGAISRSIENIELNFEKGKLIVERHDGETDGVPALVLNLWIPLLILVLFGFAELPINSTLFEMLKLGAWGRLLVGLLLVFIIPAIAHGVGLFFKQYKANIFYKVGAWLFLLLLLGFAYTMAFFRFVYFNVRELLDAGSIEQTIFDLMSQFGMNDAFGSSEFWINFILNLLLIGFGITLGYKSHDSSPIFENHYKKYHNVRSKKIEQLSKLKKKEALNASIGAVGISYDAYRSRINKMENQHAVLTAYVVGFYQHVNSKVSKVIATYRSTFSNHVDKERVPDRWNAENNDAYITPPKFSL